MSGLSSNGILAHVDVLVAGRYVQSSHVGRGLLGSANQRIHFLTDRYRPGDLEQLPGREVIIHADGTLTLSGIESMSAPRGSGRSPTWGRQR